MPAGKLGRRRKSFSKSSLLRRGLRYGVDQLEARRMLAVDFDFVTSAGTWSQENGADILTVDPGAVFVVTAHVKSSDEGLTSFQLNFENSDLAGNALELSTWTREFVWGLNFDGQLNTPQGDTFVSAASDFTGTPLASPVSLGSFVLSAPTAPGDYLLTINSGGSGPFDTQFIGTSSADALPVTDYGDLIIRVQPPLPVLSLAAQNADQPEGDSGTTDFTFTVTRTGDLSGASSAEWSVGSLGGIFGADELDFGGEFPSGTVNFAPGEAVQTIAVPVRGDLIAEEDEHFYVIISNIQGGTFGSTQAQGNIRNDDQAVLLSVTHLQQLEGDEGSTELIFTVVLDAPAETDLVIPFTTMDGTAIAGSDYNPVSGQLTFAPNEQVKTIAVSLLGDLEEEGHETFLLDVGGVAATGTILDDDGSLPYQIVRGKSASQTAIAGEHLSVPIQYNVSDGDDTLSGLGLRVHFDSSMLTFESVADVLSTNLFVTASVQLDFGDYDGNPDTDKFLLISWADLFGGSWPGPGHPLPVDLLTANFTLAENLPAGAATQITFSSSSSAASHEFLGVPVDVKVTDVTLDIDSNGAADALSDGVIIVRHLFGASGNALVDGVLPGNSERTDPAEIAAFLERASLAGMLDVDGNGVSDALSDGIILVRYLFGATGTALVDGVLPGDAVRTDPQEISNFIAAFLPSPAPAITPLFDSEVVRADNGEGSLADSILLRMMGRETQSCLVSSEADLHLEQLWENSPQLFDVDGDGHVNALTDGTLISRYFAGAEGNVLVADAIASAGTRTEPEEIRAYLDQLFLPSRETRNDSLQIVTPTPETQTAQAGEAVSFDVMYTTEPEDNTLTGLGLRLHFDSSKLQFSDASNLLSPTFLPPTLTPDDADLDGDPSTDMYVSVAWADFGGNWPSTSLPTRLYTANFVTVGDFSGETTLNFTDSSTAANFDLMATSAVIKAAQPVDLSISAPPPTAEGNSETTPFEFQVELAQNPELPVTVDLSTFDLTAIAGQGDYTPLTTTLTFEPGGPLVQTVTVEVAGDLRIEGDETFELKVTGSSGPVNVVQDTAVATILNDDFAEVEFVAESETIDEADTVYNLLVRLDTGGQALETDVRVDLLDLFDGSSTSGNDYAELGAQTITFPAGSADGATLSVPITILDDNLVEGDETASFGLTGVAGPAKLGSRDTHLLTVRDDEQAQVQFLLATSEVVEGDTEHEVQIRLATDGVLAYPVTVDVVDLLTGTATRGLDYAHFSPQAITFDVGAADGATQSATLSILDDGLLESGESIALGLEAISGPATLTGPTSHQVMILDNEVAIEFSLSGDTEVVEGETATYTVSYDGTLPVGTTASIDVSLIDIDTTPADRSDLLAALGEAVALADGVTLSDNTITFAAGGDTSLTFAIEAIDDAVPSLNSNFQLALSNPGASGNVVSSVTQSEVTTTLRDDEAVADVLLTVVDLNGTPGLVVGEQFEVDVHFRDLVHLQAVFAGYADIQFDPTLLRVDGIRFADDYPFGRTGTIDNAQGLVDEVGATDGVLPAGETVVFTLQMTALAAATTTITSDVADAGLSEIVLFGNDADYRQNTQFGSLELEIEQATLLSFEQATTEVGEDSTTLDIYVRLSTGGPALLEEVSVDVVDTLSGSASSGLDYSQFAAQTVIFPAGSADGTTQKISLEIRNDLLVESKEEIHLALANLTGQAEFGLINQHVVTIIDDEVAEVVFDTASSTTNEADAEHSVVVRLNTGGGTLAEEVTVGIQDLLSGSALSGVDYAALAGASVTFAAGSVDGATQSLLLTPLNDDLVEGDENIELALVDVTGPASLGIQMQHSVTMTDDDFAVVTFDMPSSDAAEDGGVHNIVIRLDTGGATLAKAISIDLLDLASGSASSQLDYAEVGTHTLTFAAGSVDGATQTFLLDILDDNLIEGNETIYLALANPTGPAGLGPDTVQEINLIDTEPDLVAVGFDALSDHILLGRTDLTITIANQGNGAAGAFEFDLIWSDDAVLGNEDDIVVTTITVPAGIAANDSVELTLSDVQLDRSILFARALRDAPAGQAVGTLSTESDLLAIAIDPRNAINELNEDNNTDQGLGVDADFVSYFPWDIDGSGQVTPTDAAYVVNRLEGSDPLADLDGDGTVSQAEGQAVLERIGYLRNLVDPVLVRPASDSNPGHLFDRAASVLYDLATSLEQVIPSAENESGWSEIAGSPGMAAWIASLGTPEGPLSPGTPIAEVPEFQADIVHGGDDRTQVTNTTAFPFSSIVRLLVTFPSGASFFGTGALIDGYHVLTAGHVIHDVDEGGFAVDVDIFAGQNGDEKFFGEADATFLRSYNGWTANQDSDFDFGLVTLDRNLGLSTGWMGRRVLSDADYNNGVSFNTAGYPGDRSVNGVDMYFAFGPVAQATANRVFYTGLDGLDTAGGQSGSPLYVYNSSTDERSIAAVHTTGGTTYNGGTRLNQTRFNDLITWTNDDDNARQPTDLPDLVDWDTWFGTSFAGFSSSTVSPGDSWVVGSNPRNNGTAPSGNFTVDFYASTNDIISSGDILLGSVNMSSLSPFEFAQATLSLTSFPNIPAGEYFVGWIIDQANTVTEFLQGANIGVVSQKLTVGNHVLDDAYEENDTRQTAADPLNNGGHWADTPLSNIQGLGVANDDDWYRIEVPSGRERLLVNLGFSHASGDLDIRVVDQNGTAVAYGSSVSDNEFIDVTLPSAGTWYLHVYPFGGSGNTYDLMWNTAPAGVPLPNLRGTSFDVVQTSLNAGDTFDVELTVTNDGLAGASNIQISIYVSPDPTLTTQDAFVVTDFISGLAAGASTNVSLSGLSLRPPGDHSWTGNGDYYIGMMIDPLNQIPEYDETDNSGLGNLMDYEIVPIGNAEAPGAGVRLFAVDRDGATIVEIDEATGDVINHFPVPGAMVGSGADGLAFNGTSLFYAGAPAFGGSGILYELNPETGQVIDSDSFASLGLSGAIDGLGFFQGEVIASDTSTGQLFFINPTIDQITSIVVQASIPAGGLTGAESRGTVFAGNFNAGEIYEIDPEFGTVINTIPAPTSDILGLAFIDGILLAGDAASGTIYLMNPDTGNVLHAVTTSLSISALAGGISGTGGVDGISGRIWEDANGDGIQNTGEAGMPGVVVYVDQNQNGQFDDGELTAVTSSDNPDTPGTDEGGYYAFSNLAPGTYVIRELVPNDYQLTYPTSPSESSPSARPAIELIQEYQVGERVRPLGYLGDVQPNIVTVDNPANHEVSPGSGYDGVVRLYIERFDLGGFVTCTGTLLEGGTHILTAAHCLADDWGDVQAGIVDVQFDLPGGTQFIPASTVTVHAQYDGFELNNDIAIVQLSQMAPAEAERYGIFRGTTELGPVGTKVGYGRSGTGDVGDVIASGTKRLAHNTYEGFGEIFNSIFGFGNLPGTQLAFDFDNGSPANDAFGVVFGTQHVGLGIDEGNSASGDSGGPTFLNVAGELLIAGVTSYGFGFNGAPDVTPGTDSSFGEFSVDTRVSAYADWIDSIVGTTTGGSTKTPGNGFWTVVLEAGDAVNDVNFGNRQSGMLPDLIGTAFDVEATDDTVVPGSSVTLSFSLQNIGGVAINCSYDVGFYLSTDPHISTSDTLIGFIVGGPLLQAGGVHNGIFTASIPQSLAPGDYYIGMIVDDLNDLVEANETNNANRGLGIDIDDITIAMPAGNLEGTIWIDVNGNGTRDTGEPGHAGVTVFLDLNNNGVLDSGEPTTVTSTDDAGTATVDEAGQYAFPNLPPGSYTVSELVPAGFEQTFPTPPTSEFDLEVNFTDDSLTPSQQAIFSLAAARWAEIIIGDIPDVNIAGFGLVDDLVIDASAPHIDGPGGILGQAGPTVVRTGSFLPARGIMQFDAADLAHLEATGQLMDVILHEMGHVIGIGTIWQDLGLLVGAGSADPRFTGTNATAQYNTIFGLSGTSVPVANTGGAGTRDAHWREADLHNELMTGFLNGGIVNPLSRITVGSLADLGYVVNLDAADDYSPPGLQALARRAVEGELLALDLPKQLVTPLETAAGLRQPQLEVGAGSHRVYLSPGETISGLDFGNQPLADAPLVVVGVDINGGLIDPSDLSKGEQPTSWAVQRSQLAAIRVTFSDDIVSLSASDLVLRNLGVQADTDPDTDIALQDSQLTVSGNSLTIDLSGHPLQDGVYELELLPSIQSQTGVALDGNGDGVGGDAFLLSGSAANGLFQLQADFNGDGTVSEADYPTFEYWFGTSVPAAPAYVDLNSDGGVSAPDFFTFQQNFGAAGGLVFPTVQLEAARTGMAVRLDPAETFSHPLDARRLQHLGAEVLPVSTRHLPPRDTQTTTDTPLIAENAADAYFGNSNDAFGNLELLEDADAFDLWELSEDSSADQESVDPTLEDLVWATLE